MFQVYIPSYRNSWGDEVPEGIYAEATSAEEAWGLARGQILGADNRTRAYLLSLFRERQTATTGAR